MDAVTLIGYVILIVVGLSAMIIRHDTKALIARSDKIQKTLNEIIRKEQR